MPASDPPKFKETKGFGFRSTVAKLKQKEIDERAQPGVESGKLKPHGNYRHGHFILI